MFVVLLAIRMNPVRCTLPLNGLFVASVTYVQLNELFFLCCLWLSVNSCRLCRMTLVRLSENIPRWNSLRVLTESCVWSWVHNKTDNVLPGTRQSFPAFKTVNGYILDPVGVMWQDASLHCPKSSQFCSFIWTLNYSCSSVSVTVLLRCAWIPWTQKLKSTVPSFTGQKSSEELLLFMHQPNHVHYQFRGKLVLVPLFRTRRRKHWTHSWSWSSLGTITACSGTGASSWMSWRSEFHLPKFGNPTSSPMTSKNYYSRHHLPWLTSKDC